MKLYSVLGLLVRLATALPSSSLSKRAAIDDACNLGFATQNGGTTGGQGGETVTVSSLDDFSSAASQEGPLIIIIDSNLSGGARVPITSDKTIVGSNDITLNNIGLEIDNASNVIIRNLIFTNVESQYGDAITITETSNVWVDHCEFSSVREGGNYDGCVDITRASDYVTVSHTYFHDHRKVTLVGADDGDTDDEGRLHVTYANNHFENNVSRGPLLRFGTGHIYNCYYDRQSNAVNLRIGAQALIQSTVFEDCTSAVVSENSDVDGYAVLEDVELGGGEHTAPEGTLTEVPYEYELLGSGSVRDAVVGEAGATLTF